MTAINGERIWITGASSGIGKSIALLLAEQGNQVIVSARGKSALDELAASHSNITALVCDVSEYEQIPSHREQLQQISPYLDRIIVNAGTCEYLDISQPDWDMMRRVMAVNYFGSIHAVAAAMPLLQARPGGKGHIVGVASMAAFVPFSRAEAYGSSKAALQYFLDSLRIDLIPQGIDVTVVNPGFVKTPLTDKNDFDMPFMVEVDKAAERIVKAIAKRPRQYDFPGRLKYLLKTLGFFPALWHSVIAPALRT
jgi:short-subunit dehydrogenase